jgi:hypothetical protein
MTASSASRSRRSLRWHTPALASRPYHTHPPLWVYGRERGVTSSEQIIPGYIYMQAGMQAAYRYRRGCTHARHIYMHAHTHKSRYLPPKT